MTKPANFPGRVNERRGLALERLTNYEVPEGEDQAKAVLRKREMKALRLSIDKDAYTVHTKKNRVGTGKF